MQTGAMPLAARWASSIAFAGLLAVAASMLPARAATAGNDSDTPTTLPATAESRATDAPRKVSPYAVASRQHAQAARGAPVPVSPPTVPRSHKPAGKVQH